MSIGWRGAGEAVGEGALLLGACPSLVQGYLADEKGFDVKVEG